MVTNEVSPAAPRRSARPLILPKHLDVYELDLPPSLVNSLYKYPIHPYLTTRNFSIPYKSIIASISVLVEPSSYAEACKHEVWQQAMSDEIASLESNGT